MKCPNNCNAELVPARRRQTFLYEGNEDAHYFDLVGEYWYCPEEVCIYRVVPLEGGTGLERITK